jgi:hypothetical protein
MITSAQAENYHLSCIAADLKSSIEITSSKDRMIFSYKNKEGKKYFPLYNGIVTASSLSHLKSAKHALHEIDNELSFSWPIENCSIRNEELFLAKCSSDADVILPARSGLKANTFSTSLIAEQSFSFIYEKLSFRFILHVDNDSYEILIPFSKERCQVSLEK